MKTEGKGKEMYSFDKGIERRNTNCEKWDAPFVGKDVLPMWVADMDFEIAPAITERLVKAAGKGAFGYQFLSDRYYRAVQRFMEEKHDYAVKRDWICYVTNVVQGLFLALEAVSEKGDEVIIQTPVYGPFFRVVKESGRRIAESRLRNQEGYYTMDYEDLKARITDRTKAFLLCNPHNPSGRVWTEEELRKLAEICAEHHICIISDDIHSDIIRKESRHTMIAPICRSLGGSCISCTSPSKPFNLASVHVANCLIEDDAIRKEFRRFQEIYHMKECNAFAEEALIGAYEESDGWLQEVNEYIEENIDVFIDYIQKNIPVLKVRKPEGTYLVWVDFSQTDIPPEDIKKVLKERCRILVNEGEFFGEAGKGFVRFNLACPRSYVEQALERLNAYFS